MNEEISSRENSNQNPTAKNIDISVSALKKRRPSIYVAVVLAFRYLVAGDSVVVSLLRFPSAVVKYVVACVELFLTNFSSGFQMRL